MGTPAHQTLGCTGTHPRASASPSQTGAVLTDTPPHELLKDLNCLRLLLKGPEGGGGVWGPGQPRPTYPPTHIRKFFPQEKNEIYQRSRKFEAEFRHTTFFWPLTHPLTDPFSLSNSLLTILFCAPSIRCRCGP